jgi:hypothetical protein
LAEVHLQIGERETMATDNLLSFNVEPYDLYSYFFESVVGLELARRGLHHTFHGRFGYVQKLPEIVTGRDLLASEIDRKGEVLRELRAWEAGLLEIRIERMPETRQRIEAWGYFDSKETARRCLSELSGHLPAEIAQLDDEKVSVNFWNSSLSRGEYVPRHESQTMSVPDWQDIAMNYPEQVRPELASTMQLQDRTSFSSRLMLWRGLPGTGKTWAVRALMREWRDWCTFHYVVDPAVFFSNSTYMLSLLSKISELSEDEDGARKWSLIMIEDAGEYLAIDSRYQHGQGLAKLLNLCDGLLGQGQKLLFLITTNEELTNLHPAIVRHGRCLTNLEFPEFSELEAHSWLKAHGCAQPRVLKRLTLSDLFAAAKTQAAIANSVPSKRVGFVR